MEHQEQDLESLRVALLHLELLPSVRRGKLEGVLLAQHRRSDFELVHAKNELPGSALLVDLVVLDDEDEVVVGSDVVAGGDATFVGGCSCARQLALSFGAG